MTEFLKVSKTRWDDVKVIRSSLSNGTLEFDNISFDYMTISIYADFEKELNSLIQERLSENDFSKKYANFVKTRYKQLHGGLNGVTFKSLIKDVFSNVIDVNNKDWVIYTSFIDFRNSISHDDKYDEAKEKLMGNIKNFDTIFEILSKYLNMLKNG